MLDFKVDREGVPPKDAATIVLVRDAAGGEGVEIFCVERNKASRFMGGAIVFPGGKVDASDGDEAWAPLAGATAAVSGASGSRPSSEAFSRAAAIAACRETLEEAGILHVSAAREGAAMPTQAELLELRKSLAADAGALRAFLAARGLRLDLAALRPFARWITPTAVSRRFDARFFVAACPPGLTGAHDEHETMASFWATPREILRRFDAGEVQLMPPTHRTVRVLLDARSSADVLSRETCLDPICPKLVPQGETMALVLPGDREHDVREARVPGPSRYVLRGERWLPEDAP